MSDNQAARNTDREIWRGPDEGNGSFYADSIHVTEQGGIGINVGGTVFVKPVREWHRLAAQDWPPRVEGSSTGAPCARDSDNMAREAVANAMATKRRELQHMPLERIWGELAEAALAHVPRSAASTVEPVADPLHGLDERLDRLFVSNECGDGFVLSARSASNIVGIVREWIRAKSAAPTTSPEPDAVRDLAGVLAAELAPKFDAFLSNPGNPHLAADLRQWFWDNKSGVLAALSRPAHGGWKDISTAPTDGTPIEGCYHDDPEADALPVTSAFWSRISECWYSDIAGKPVKLTHWRPLSRRPALARNQGQGGGPRS